MSLDASEADRSLYRQELSDPKLKRAFDELTRLLADKRDDLRWHHAVGLLVRRFRPAEKHGSAWADGLHQGLGPARSFFTTAVRFIALYPTVQSLSELEAMGVRWTTLTLSFAIRSEKARHALLRKAVRGKWNDAQFRLELRKRNPTKRRGVGGRPRKEVPPMGSEDALYDLQNRGRSLADFFEQAWQGVTAQQWQEFISTVPADQKEKRYELLSKAIGTVRAVARGCADAQATLKTLQNGIVGSSAQQTG